MKSVKQTQTIRQTNREIRQTNLKSVLQGWKSVKQTGKSVLQGWESVKQIRLTTTIRQTNPKSVKQAFESVKQISETRQTNPFRGGKLLRPS